MNVYQKAWFFVKPYKIKIFIMLIMLTIAQLMIVINPLITKSLLDDYIVGVTMPWSIVETSNDDMTIEYEDMYLKQQRYLDSDDVVISDVSLIVDNNQYYLVEGNVDENSDLESVEIISKVASEDIQLFYSPVVGNMIILVVLLFTVLTVQVLTTYIQRRISALTMTYVTRDARLMAMDKINYMHLEEVEAQPAGKMANRIIGDASGMGQLINSLINSYYSAIVSIIFSLTAMFLLVPELGIFLIFLVPFLYFWIIYFNKRINKIAVKINETNSLLIAKINEVINGISILKIFNTQKKTLDDFSELNDQFIDESLEEVNLHLKAGWNCVNLTSGLLGGAIIIIFAILDLNNVIAVEAGLLLAYYTYTTRLLSPILVLFQQFGIIEHSKVKTERYYNILNAETEDKTFEIIDKAEGSIDFENVNFSYVKGNPILKNINLSIDAHQKVGLVGHTGSGKSTMMNLLMRFNDLKDDEGNIYLDKTSISKHTKRTYRQNIGIILQEPVLFNSSLRDNILFGSEMTDDELLEILNQIGANFLIKKMDNGLDEMISPRGGNLSLGEKQLISFARILVKNPPIIIMDEATANIDIETEMMIQNALKVISKDRTLIIIAHRLSTIVDSDLIVVLSEGEIIEKGTHEQLISNDFYYANMYRSQVA